MNIPSIQNYNLAKTQLNKASNVSFGWESSGYFGCYENEDADTFNTRRDKKLLSQDEGLKVANKFRSSTSGYRGAMGEVFSDKFVYSMTNAVADYMKDSKQLITIVGGDTRPATKKYAPEIKEMLLNKGIDVFVPKLKGAKKNEISPVATPVLAVATRDFGVPLSILLTASHNPWNDGGYNFLTDEGAIADEKVTEPLAKKLEFITAKGATDTNKYTKGVEFEFDPYEIYMDNLKCNNLVDFDKIAKANIEIYYDDLEGTGSYYFPRILKDNNIALKKLLRTHAKGPNPNEENLKNLANDVKKSSNYLKIGLATDGDSDRFGVIDENGKFISADDVILLASYHAIKNKGYTQGTLITNQASSAKIQALADYFNKNGVEADEKIKNAIDMDNIKIPCRIDLVQTPVGFKYISTVIEKREGTGKQVIVAGEESGGLTIRGNVPEKDGFIALLTMLELVASEKKPIGEILNEINEKIGEGYTSKCINMKFDSDDDKNAAVSSFIKYMNGTERDIAGIEIDENKTKDHAKKMTDFKPTGDGTKIYLQDGSSVLVRKSGTEPIMRLYINGTTPDAFDKLANILVTDAKTRGGKPE